jgi:hypothetical protein
MSTYLYMACDQSDESNSTNGVMYSCVSHMITNVIVDVIIDSCFWCNVSFISYWNLGLLQKMLKYFGYFGA